MFKIVSLDNRDINQIIDLILPIQQIEHGVPVTIQDQPDLLDIEKNYLNTGGGFWGFRYEDQIVGTIALIKMADGQGGVIRKMFVKKEFRGSTFSLAQKLLEQLITYAEHAGITNLYLGTVHILQAAIRFYERNHFHPIHKTHLPSNFPLMEVDNTFYHLKLKKA